MVGGQAADGQWTSGRWAADHLPTKFSVFGIKKSRTEHQLEPKLNPKFYL
jgi:hypothetical protein